MQDAWRAYLEMALGLTEAPRKRAQKAAGDLVSRGGATAAQLQGLVEDLMGAGMANREALTNIVRYEVDRALGVVGLATAEEVHDLTARVRELEKQLRDAQARASAAEQNLTGAGIGGERVQRPAPLPATKAAPAPAVKAAKKSPPNQMPAAATTPAKKVAAKKVAKKAAKSVPPAPAGTAEPPVAPVRDAAAATEVPPVKKSTPRKTATPAQKTTPAQKATPVRKATPANGAAPAQKASPVRKATPAKKTAARKTEADQ